MVWIHSKYHGSHFLEDLTMHTGKQSNENWGFSEKIIKIAIKVVWKDSLNRGESSLHIEVQDLVSIQKVKNSKVFTPDGSHHNSLSLGVRWLQTSKQSHFVQVPSEDKTLPEAQRTRKFTDEFTTRNQSPTLLMSHLGAKYCQRHNGSRNLQI